MCPSGRGPVGGMAGAGVTGPYASGTSSERFSMRSAWSLVGSTRSSGRPTSISFGCGAEVNTAYVERNNLTMRQSVGRLVRKALSFSKNVHFLHRHIALDDAIYNFVKPHGALRRRVRSSTPQG